MNKEVYFTEDSSVSRTRLDARDQLSKTLLYPLIVDTRESAVSDFLFRLSIHVTNTRPGLLLLLTAHQPLGVIVMHGEIERQLFDVLGVIRARAVRCEIGLTTVGPGLAEHRCAKGRSDQLTEHIQVRQAVFREGEDVQRGEIHWQRARVRRSGDVRLVGDDSIGENGIPSGSSGSETGLEDQRTSEEKMIGEKIDGVRGEGRRTIDGDAEHRLPVDSTYKHRTSSRLAVLRSSVT